MYVYLCGSLVTEPSSLIQINSFDHVLGRINDKVQFSNYCKCLSIFFCIHANLTHLSTSDNRFLSTFLSSQISRE